MLLRQNSWLQNPEQTCPEVGQLTEERALLRPELRRMSQVQRDSRRNEKDPQHNAWEGQLVPGMTYFKVFRRREWCNTHSSNNNFRQRNVWSQVASLIQHKMWRIFKVGHWYCVNFFLISEIRNVAAQDKLEGSEIIIFSASREFNFLTHKIKHQTIRITGPL